MTKIQIIKPGQNFTFKHLPEKMSDYDNNDHIIRDIEDSVFDDGRFIVNKMQFVLIFLMVM